MNNLMRICIVSEFPPPIGGIAQQAQLLFDSLEKDGVQMYKVSTNCNQGGILTWLCRIRYLKTLITFSKFLIQLIWTLPRASNVHILASSHLNYFLFTYPAVLFGKLLKKQIIIHYHGGDADKFFEKWKFLARFPVRLSDYFLVPSAFLSDVFKKHGIRSLTIPNIINLDSFSYYERKSYKPTFLVTRHLEPLYNISCAVKAFAEIRKHYGDAVFNIIGDGSETEMLKKLASDLGCADSIYFHGAVSHDEIHKFYKISDILLNTSFVDNMPISILEAFASGCAVVSTKAGGIPYMINHKVTGFLVELDDHKGLAREILWLLQHQKETKMIVNAARKYIQDFSWDNIKVSLYQMYTKTETA